MKKIQKILRLFLREQQHLMLNCDRRERETLEIANKNQHAHNRASLENLKVEEKPSAKKIHTRKAHISSRPEAT
jgi:hypothetical protein